MKTLLKNYGLLAITALSLVACSFKRLGVEIPPEQKGNLETIVFKPVEDGIALQTYHSWTLSKFNSVNKEIAKLWLEMKTNLNKPDVISLEKRTRIGRLLEQSKIDKSGSRGEFVELWAIRYGQKIHGADADLAEKVLTGGLFQDVDFSVTLSAAILQHCIAPDSSLGEMTQEQKEQIENIDHYFLTGEKTKE